MSITQDNNKYISNLMTSESTAVKIKQLYKTKPKLLKGIVNLYKFIFLPIEKQIKKQTPNDISDNVTCLEYGNNINAFIKQNYADIANIENKIALINKKVEALPPFLDFCFIYYAHYFDDSAPFYKLPNTNFKFNLICNLCKYMKCRPNINKAFNDIISDKLIKDMRMDPPYHMRADKTPDEMLNDLLTNAKPLCSQLLNEILLLKNE